ncbi:MAG TPA: alpha/beta hydrolase [Stellaceae bacterium]|nr:alpha/beta hydrolase [Stellaceae bacterium]
MERIDIGEASVEALVAGEGPPLLFLHGIDYFAQHRPFLDRLARQFRVIAPRHPGFGTSPRPTWMRGVGDIAYLYLDLLDRLELRDVLLVGASFGGWLAMELAVRSTARLRGLVLIDSLGLKFGDRDETEIADIFALPVDEAVRRAFADPANAPDYGKFDDAAIEEVARDREAAVLYGWRPFMHNPSLRHWLHRIDIPALVLWGVRDRITAPAYGAHLVQKLPDARFIPIAAAGHYPQIEQPEKVAELIEQFASGMMASSAAHFSQSKGGRQGTRANDGRNIDG